MLDRDARQFQKWVQTTAFASKYPQERRLVDAFQQFLCPPRQPRAPDLAISPIALPLRSGLYHVAIARWHYQTQTTSPLSELAGLCIRPEAWLVFAHFTTSMGSPDWAGELSTACKSLRSPTTPCLANINRIGRQKWSSEWSGAISTVAAGCRTAQHHPTSLFAEATTAATVALPALLKLVPHQNQP